MPRRVGPLLLPFIIIIGLIMYSIDRAEHRTISQRETIRVEEQTRNQFSDTSLGTIPVHLGYDRYREEYKPYSRAFRVVPEDNGYNIFDVDKGFREISQAGILWKREGRRDNNRWWAESILGQRLYKPSYQLCWFSEWDLLRGEIEMVQAKGYPLDIDRDRLAKLKHEIEALVQSGRQELYIIRRQFKNDEKRFVTLNDFRELDSGFWGLKQSVRSIHQDYLAKKRPGLLAQATLPIWSDQPEYAYDNTFSVSGVHTTFPKRVCLSPNKKWLALLGEGAWRFNLDDRRQHPLREGLSLSNWIMVVPAGQKSDFWTADVVVQTREKVAWVNWLADGRLMYAYENGEVRTCEYKKGLG